MTLEQLYEEKGRLHWTIEVAQAKLNKVNSQILKLHNETEKAIK